jgi:hypothetical protein
LQARPDRLLIYLALALVAAAIASITGPSAGLLTLLQVVVVVEAINLLGAPGDGCDGNGSRSGTGD